jgi:hypothetical protein
MLVYMHRGTCTAPGLLINAVNKKLQRHEHNLSKHPAVWLTAVYETFKDASCAPIPVPSSMWQDIL